jgi:hypothetical protein
MVRVPPTVILLRRGEVPFFEVLLFQRGSTSADLSPVKSSLELPIVFLTWLSSYLSFLSFFPVI